MISLAITFLKLLDKASDDSLDTIEIGLVCVQVAHCKDHQDIFLRGFASLTEGLHCLFQLWREQVFSYTFIALLIGGQMLLDLVLLLLGHLGKELG